MKSDFKNICRLFSLLLGLFCGVTAVLADEAHYKNMLVGERAATMGGSYVAVSDDSTGCYYNPAGIVHAVGDSLSGSGNVAHQMRTVYHEAIGYEDWNRESEALLPNYFGILKKYETLTLCFSYVVPEAFIEHQDLVFDEPLSSIKRYYQSIHSEDITYLMGPSGALRFSENFSMGLTLYYHYRKFLRQQHFYLEGSTGGYEIFYESKRRREDGFMPKIGFQWSPWNPLTLGVALDKTFLSNSDYTSDVTYQNTMTRTTSDEKREFPTHLALALALYPTPSQLYSLDVDYYKAAESSGRADIMNFSGGTEIYLNPTNAIRFGLFTNYTNVYQPTESTTAPYEFIDSNGLSFGYTSYSRSSSLTLGAIYTTGTGKAWLYSGSTTSRKMTRESLTLLFSASSNY